MIKMHEANIYISSRYDWPVYFSVFQSYCSIYKIFRQPLKGGRSWCQGSLHNRDVENLIYKVKGQNLKTKTAAWLYDVSQRRIQQLVKEHYETGKISVIHQRGRKPKEPDENLRLEVIRVKRDLKIGSNTVTRYIRKNCGLSVDNNEVHKILVEEEMSGKDHRKCVRNYILGNFMRG